MQASIVSCLFRNQLTLINHGWAAVARGMKVLVNELRSQTNFKKKSSSLLFFFQPFISADVLLWELASVNQCGGLT